VIRSGSVKSSSVQVARHCETTLIFTGIVLRQFRKIKPRTRDFSTFIELDNEEGGDMKCK
jgi:hypothetical protein